MGKVIEYGWDALTKLEFLTLKQVFLAEHAVNTLYVHQRIILEIMSQLIEEKKLSSNEMKVLPKLGALILSRDFEKAAKELRQFGDVPSYQRTQRTLTMLKKSGWVDSRAVEGKNAKMVWFLTKRVRETTNKKLKEGDPFLKERLKPPLIRVED